MFKFELSYDKLQTDFYKKLANKAKEFLQNHKNLLLTSQVIIKNFFLF